MKTLFATLLLLLPPVLFAQPSTPSHSSGSEGQFIDQGPYRIHFAALNSMDIPPQTARALSVRRSGQRALLVLNAQQRNDDDGFDSVRAVATGEVRNLLGQDKRITFRSLRDQGTWYVLADFPIYEREHIRFDLNITPDGSDTPVRLRFDQPFYRGD